MRTTLIARLLSLCAAGAIAYAADQPALSQLQGLKKVSFKLVATSSFEVSGQGGVSTIRDEGKLTIPYRMMGTDTYVPVAWTGARFSGKQTHDAVEGEVSANGTTLVSLIYTYESAGTSYRVELADVPLAYRTSPFPMAQHQAAGAEAGRYLKRLVLDRTTTLSSGESTRSRYVSTEWSPQAQMTVTLSRY